MRLPMRARRVLRWLWVSLLASSGCLWWTKHKLRSNGAVVALVFHRVLSDKDYSQTNSQPEILVRETYVSRPCSLHEAKV